MPNEWIKLETKWEVTLDWNPSKIKKSLNNESRIEGKAIAKIGIGD